MNKLINMNEVHCPSLEEQCLDGSFTDKQEMKENNHSFVLFKKNDSLTYSFIHSFIHSITYSLAQLISQ